MFLNQKSVKFKAKKEGVVCLLGVNRDPVLQAVAKQLKRRKQPYFIFDQNQFPGEFQISYQAKALGGGIEGYLTAGDKRYAIKDIRSAYSRILGAPNSEFKHPVQGPFEEERFLAMDHLTRTWDVPTIGLLRPCATNFSKPFQISLLQSEKVLVPETLVTSRPASAVQFNKRIGQASFKSASSERSICMRLQGRWLRRLEKIRQLPVQFQEYVQGLDIRAHVAGDYVHALTISTDASDYRYSERYFGRQSRVRRVELPAEIKAELIRISRSLGLVFSGIDLRRTKSGEYFCFEVNPTPGFSYFDTRGSYPIANAVVDLLTGKTHV